MIHTALFFQHTVSVETYTGAGEEGDTYAAPVTVRGFLEYAVSVLVGGPAGDVVAGMTGSTGNIFFTEISEADKFLPESKVTANGEVFQVVTARRRHLPGVFTQVSHLEVVLK